MAQAADEQLTLLIQGTLALNETHRSESEGLLQQAQHHEGFCLALLNIANNDAADEAVRLAAAIALKNAVKRRWNGTAAELERKGHSPIPEADRRGIMTNLHSSVIRCPKIIQTQLLEVTREVAIKDFPHPWNNLLPEALPTIQSGNLVHMHGSLLMLRRVVSCLEFASQRNPTLQEFSEATLPVLAHLLHTLLADTSGQPELAVLMRTILKIFWSCIYIEIPEVLSGNADLSRQWLKGIAMLMRRPVGAGSLAAEESDREAHPEWKLRKWVLRVSYRILQRYGDPKLTRTDAAAPFAKLFMDEFTQDFLQGVLEIVQSIGRGEYCSRHAVTYLGRYLVEACKQKGPRALLLPYLHDILTRVMLPLCFFTDRLAEQWRDDPMEVIRKNSSALTMYDADDMYDVRDAATGVILEVMKIKPLREKLLEPFMKEVVALAQEFRAQHDKAPESVDVATSYRMEGVMLVVGALLPSVLAKQERFRASLEPLATAYMLPLFGSPHAFLRAKAVWVAGQYASELEFEAPGAAKRCKGQGALFDQLFDLVLKCMKDPDLPTQVEAVNAFRDFVEALDAAQRIGEKIKPILRDLLRHFFQMASVVEAMDVIMTVDKIVERIGEDIQPFAVDCCRELVQVYSKVLADRDEDEDEDVMFDAGFHILAPITKLLDACSELPGTMRTLEELLLPMLEDMCKRDPQDVLEQICEILSYFTYFTTPISARVWGMWPVLQHVLLHWGEDFVEHIIVPLENYISRDPTTFLTSESPNYRQGVWDMLEHCLTGDHDDMDVKFIAKLMDVVLLNCTGRVDEWVWPYLELATAKLATVKNPSFATLLMNVLPAALVYNTQLALQALEAHGKTQQVFEIWYKMLQDPEKFFRRAYDKKLSCTGLVCLLGVSADALPPTLTQSLPLLFKETIKTLKRLKEQEDAQRNRADSDASSEGSDEALNGSISDINDDALDEDAAYLELLEKQRQALAGTGDGQSSPLILDDWTDDEETDTALDRHDPYALLVHSMNALQSSHPAQFQVQMPIMGLVQSLDAAHKETLQEIAQFAHIKTADDLHSAGAAAAHER